MITPAHIAAGCEFVAVSPRGTAFRFRISRPWGSTPQHAYLAVGDGTSWYFMGVIIAGRLRVEADNAWFDKPEARALSWLLELVAKGEVLPEGYAVRVLSVNDVN